MVLDPVDSQELEDDQDQEDLTDHLDQLDQPVSTDLRDQWETQETQVCQEHQERRELLANTAQMVNQVPMEVQVVLDQLDLLAQEDQQGIWVLPDLKVLWDSLAQLD